MKNRDILYRLARKLEREQAPQVSRSDVLWALDILEQFLDGNAERARAMLEAGPKAHMEEAAPCEHAWEDAALGPHNVVQECSLCGTQRSQPR